MEEVSGDQDLALQHHFPQIYSKFSKIQTDLLIYSLMLRTSNLAILVFSICPFHFWRSLSYSP